MNRSDSDRRLEQHATELFERSVADLDGQTRSRLARARQRALAHTVSPVSWVQGLLSGRGLAPAGALAAVALVALVVWPGQDNQQTPVDVAALGDLEILLGEEDLDMLEELEFYTWLEEQPEFSTPNGAGDSVG